jgi:hypothetical protein
MRRKAAWRWIAAGALATSLVGRAVGAQGALSPEERGVDRRTRAAHLRAELTAAASHAVYLALDPLGRHLDLKVDGLLLRRFEIDSARFSRPRLGGAPAVWPASRFTLVTEIPEPERPRIPIQTPEEEPAQTTASGAKPQAARQSLAVSDAREEALAKMPTHYRLRFAPLLDVSIRGEAGSETITRPLSRFGDRLLEGWRNAARTVFGRANPPRVVLTLAPDEARRLFMTLDPKIQLVIAAPQ